MITITIGWKKGKVVRTLPSRARLHIVIQILTIVAVIVIITFNHTSDWNWHCIVASVLFCNCQLSKDISSNTKCLLVWCDYPVVTCLVQPILGINHPCDTNRLWVFVPNDFMCNWTRRLSLGIYLTSLIFEVRWCLWKMVVFPELW